MSMSVETPAGTSAGQSETRRTGWTGPRIAALVVTLILIVVAAFNLVSLMMSSTTTQQLSFPINGTALSVDVKGGDISVRGGDVTEIAVTRKVHRGIVDPTFSEVADADGLHLSASCPWYASGWCGVDYEIVVPQDLPASIRSGDGDVQVSDLTGDVEVVASSGDVRVENVGGDVSVRSTSGDVSLAEITGDISVGSSSGDVRASNVRSASFSVEASSGDVYARFAQPPDSIGVSASSGDVGLTVPDDGTAYAVEEKTSSGDSRVSVATDPTSSHTANLRTSSGDLSFKYG